MPCTKVFHSDLSHSNYASSLKYYFITSSFKNSSADLYAVDARTDTQSPKRNKDIVGFCLGKQINS